MSAVEDLRRDVVAALGLVMDPCSVNVGAPLSIVDMGLVTGVDVSPSGDVSIAIRSTTPMCTLIGSLLAGAEEALRAVPGVTSCTVTADHRGGWSEDAMTPAGRVFLSRRRQESRRAVPVTPRQWAS